MRCTQATAKKSEYGTPADTLVAKKSEMVETTASQLELFQENAKIRTSMVRLPARKALLQKQ
jgi:hypothetical protein